MSEKILDKLQKLIALQESAGQIGSLKEAELVAAKIAHLLAKHNLSLDQVRAAARKTGKIVVGQITQQPITEPIPDWMAFFFGAICEVNGCCGAATDRGHLVVSGLQDDREIAVRLFKYFVMIIETHGADFLLQEQKKPRLVGYMHTFVDGAFHQEEVEIGQNPLEMRVESFKLGMARGIIQQFQKANAEEMAKTQAAANEEGAIGTEALIRISPDALVYMKSRAEAAEQFLRDNHTCAGEDVRSPEIDPGAWNAGLKVGSSMAATDKTLSE